MNRRSFLQSAAASYLAAGVEARANQSKRSLGKAGYSPGRIVNEYSLLLPGEREALSEHPTVSAFGHDSLKVRIGKTSRILRIGDSHAGWQLLTVSHINGVETAVLEKRVSHQGAIVFVTESEGVILDVGERIGQLSNIRPRPTKTGESGVSFVRQVPYVPGPDVPGNYILNSDEDPCYENVAALGAEYIGYTLVANEQGGPLRSLFLEADGKSRQLSSNPEAQGLWAPDLVERVFDPERFFPGENPDLFRYLDGHSKRTLLNGYLPIANIGVWNPATHAGYEVIVLLPPGTDARPAARIRFQLPPAMARALSDAGNTIYEMDGSFFLDHYWNSSPQEFYSSLAGIANYWQHFFEDHMTVGIPDPWLLDAARAGITLSRCSYRGLEPTYQIGEGAYTKIPEQSHALFPVAQYEFVWAHQLWNLTRQVDDYFQYYLDRYILPDGNFLYNTQDQVEAPLNTGIFLWNSARSYDYTHDLASFEKRLPIMRRMIEYVLERYAFSKTQFASDDRRYGLIWGSPEADLGDPHNDFPNSHPFYFQNAVWTWRGLHEHARCLALIASEHNVTEIAGEAKRIQGIADEMRPLIAKSLAATIAAGNAEMRQAGITPFSPDDIDRKPDHLTSYENHRFMMDWFTADWGDSALDEGHFKHRQLAGQQIMGMHTDGAVSRTSNFMEHGTLAGRIRQDDYRPFLLTLYGLTCYAADSGNRYAPEDAYLPGSYPGEGSPYGWSAVVNSVLQPALGLRWLLCYEESDKDLCHLQKGAPKHWFAAGESIKVEKCPTRFGLLSWQTKSVGGREWEVTLDLHGRFEGDIAVHIHPQDDRELQLTTGGIIQNKSVILKRADLKSQQQFKFAVR